MNTLLKIYHRFVFSILCLFLFFPETLISQNLQDQNCFSVLVGKEASDNGAVLLAHNEDDSGERMVNWFKMKSVAKPDFEFSYLFPEKGYPYDSTLAYFWLDMPEMHFSDSYVNSKGVAIVSNQCLSREDKPSITKGGLTYELRNCMAAFAHSARDAVKIASTLIEEYGYASSGRTYCIADSHEGWMLSVVNGKHWIAARIPDNEVAVIPNYYTITQIDLSDTANYYASDDLIDYAIERGWYNPENKKPFNFRDVYSNPENLKNMGNVLRMWRGISLLSGENFSTEDDFPFSFKPLKKINKKDLMSILRDHYESTPYDLSEHYSRANPHFTKNASICSETTQYGLIAELRGILPEDCGQLLWIAPYRPCNMPFMPWYTGLLFTPEDYKIYPEEKALEYHFNPPEKLCIDNNNAFLIFKSYTRKIDKNYLKNISPAREYAHKTECYYFNRQEKFEKQLLKKKKHSGRLNMITDYSSRSARKLKNGILNVSTKITK